MLILATTRREKSVWHPHPNVSLWLGNYMTRGSIFHLFTQKFRVELGLHEVIKIVVVAIDCRDGIIIIPLGGRLDAASVVLVC